MARSLTKPGSGKYFQCCIDCLGFLRRPSLLLVVSGAVSQGGEIWFEFAE